MKTVTHKNKIYAAESKLSQRQEHVDDDTGGRKREERGKEGEGERGEKDENGKEGKGEGGGR